MKGKTKQSKRPAPAYEQQLLGWVNRMRKKIDPRLDPVKRLPKGEVSDGSSCPLANAIARNSNGEAIVDGSAVLFYRHIDGFANPARQLAPSTPAYVRRFIEHFDGGDYPGLERR